MLRLGEATDPAHSQSLCLPSMEYRFQGLLEVEEGQGALLSIFYAHNVVLKRKKC